jgi:hypothetical protein
VGGWFCSIRSPRALPGGPGMAWDRRMNLSPNPEEIEKPGARLGRISPDVKNGSWEASRGDEWRCSNYSTTLNMEQQNV